MGYVKGCNDIFTSNQALAVHVRTAHQALFKRPNNNRVYRDTQYDEALLLRSAESGQPLFVLQEVVDNAEEAEEAEVAEVAEVADDGDSQAANLGENLDPDISGYMLETLDSVALSTAASVTIPAETYVIVDDGSA